MEMKKVLAMIVVLLLATIGHASTSTGIDIIPAPAVVKILKGQFELRPNTKIAYSKEAYDVAEYLSSRLRVATDYDLKLKAINSSKRPEYSDTISLIISGAEMNVPSKKEGYYLNVRPKNIVIYARDGAGLFYGVQSLLQLLPPEIESVSKVEDVKWSIPCVEITDHPRFGWRGYMLDASRHFQDVAFVKKTLDMMAFYKLNTFHWHIVDCHGWRLEIKKYSKLTEIGAWRKQPGYDDGKGGNIYGGFYTQDEIREIVAYAKDRYITIVPEIEMPGHSRAAIASYYDLSCDSFPPTMVDYFFDFPHNGKGWPGHKGSNVLCAGKEFTFEFLENVLAETLALFPSEFIHIGGDEASKAFWHKCKFCQKRMKDEGLANEHELQSYFVKRIEKYLNSKGRRLIGWNEILEGGLAPNATVMSWQGVGGGIKAARAGHDVVMSPQEYIYFDHPESNVPGYPLSWGNAISSLETVYNYEPIPSELTSAQAKHVLGVQANMWTIYAHTDELIEFMTYPRLCALAEIAWTSRDDLSWEDFQTRMETHFKRLDALGVANFRDTSVTVGTWTPTEMPETFKTVSYDVTDVIEKYGDGKYDVTFQYTGGAHKLDIDWAAIYQGQTELSRDSHYGFTGARHIGNTYRLDIKTLSPGEEYTLKAQIRSNGETDSNGYVSISKQGAIAVNRGN